MHGNLLVCLYKGRQIEKKCINFFEESGLRASSVCCAIDNHLPEFSLHQMVYY